VPVAASISIGLGYLILLIAGTIGTLWFVRTAWKRAEGDPGRQGPDEMPTRPLSDRRRRSE